MASGRRSFLRALGVSLAASAVPRSVERALTIPAQRRSGTIADVEHIVILMQENRSFDHYFGTLRGVRGFGDPRAARLPDGKSVFEQPNGASTLLPFRPAEPNLGLTFLEGLPHDWADTHAAWRRGNCDAWVDAKGTTSMVHLTRQDIPLHFALADAFTVCDAYYCSVMGATDPNRYHLWTGFTGNGSKAGPVLDNAAAGYDFSTYPERLSDAGVSWKIYQDAGEGLDEAHGWGWAKDPYTGSVDFEAGTLDVGFENHGQRAAVFQARAGTRGFGPWTYSVGPGQRLLERFALGGLGRELYELTLHGPNGFFRAFQGATRGLGRPKLELRTRYDREPGIALTIQNRAARRELAKLYDAYTRVALTLELAPEGSLTVPCSLALSHGWYDLSLRLDSDPSFCHRLAGHVETGRPSMSDPLLEAALTPTRESG